MSKQIEPKLQDVEEVVVDLEDLLEVDEYGDIIPVPPPPPRGEFEGWEEGEEDLT